MQILPTCRHHPVPLLALGVSSPGRGGASPPGHAPPSPPPVILFPELFGIGPYFNPVTGVVRCFAVPSTLTDVYYFGASKGWLLLGRDSSVSAFIPATNAHIRLHFHHGQVPHYRVFPDPFGYPLLDRPLPALHKDPICASVLSSNPASDPDLTMLIILNRIASTYLCSQNGDAACAPITVPLADFHCAGITPTRNKKNYTVDHKEEALIAFDLSDLARNITTVSSYTISDVP